MRYALFLFAALVAFILYMVGPPDPATSSGNYNFAYGTAMTTNDNKTWCITNGAIGMQAQTRAIAQALGRKCTMKNVYVREPFASIPNEVYNWWPKRYILPYVLDKTSDSLEGPYPELIISCGRYGAMVATALRALHPSAKYINIQDPRMNSKYFDLVIPMEHDHMTGENVIPIRYALHTITPESLAEAHTKFAKKFSVYSEPRVAVLLGGSTNKYDFTTEAMAKVVMSLQRLLSQTTASLLITPSRRTGDKRIEMLKALTGKYKERVYVYDGVEENPYMGMLAFADYIVVTNDSVNMMSEAAATGKPVYILPMPGHENTKPSRFSEMLIREGIARPLGSKLESWSYPIPNEMLRLAEEVKKRLGI